MAPDPGAEEAAAVKRHCTRAQEFDAEALTVENLIQTAPNEEAVETLRVMAKSWREPAELHRRLGKQWR